jgi:ribosomal protein L37E
VGRRIMRAMPDPQEPPLRITPIPLGAAATTMRGTQEAIVCDRCGGANVYRMHAVWRCADCGFKTDCCGW